MQRAILIILIAVFCLPAFAQKEASASDVQPIINTERSFEAMAGAQGTKAAYLQFLAPDSIIFRPGPINGRQFWNGDADSASSLLSRNITFADVSSNGMMGYTTGSWRLYQRGKSESFAKFGQYVTIWEKKINGKFEATIDINISHDKLPFWATDQAFQKKETRDPNKRGWSPADASMEFTKLSMTPGGGLGAAYNQFAAEKVRLLHDGDPPILGKKDVVEATKSYLSMRFPEKIALYQAADMAYTWNPCQFANSNEGMEEGNCLHIWKLKDKKWWIVLGIFARISSDTPPVLKSRDRNTASH